MCDLSCSLKNDEKQLYSKHLLYYPQPVATTTQISNILDDKIITKMSREHSAKMGRMQCAQCIWLFVDAIRERTQSLTVMNGRTLTEHKINKTMLNNRIWRP